MERLLRGSERVIKRIETRRRRRSRLEAIIGPITFRDDDRRRAHPHMQLVGGVMELTGPADAATLDLVYSAPRGDITRSTESARLPGRADRRALSTHLTQVGEDAASDSGLVHVANKPERTI